MLRAMKTVRFVTFGCKANQYDTQVLREALARRGWAEQKADSELVVINTCTVTHAAGRKARQLIRRIARENPNARIAVTGCLAESEPELLRELPAVEWVFGNGEAKRPTNFLRNLGEEVDPEELGIPAGITEFAGHTRAFVKIQDGCDLACAYCIIPKVRGKSRSRTIPELQAELTRLVSAGHVEVVLCGIHIGHWGRDLGLELADLLRALVQAEPTGADGSPLDFRLRLSSIEATEVTPDLVALFADHPERIAQHIHMPMQSGDDGVLKAMNRWYDAATYLRACDTIRAALDRPAFTADVIVGFPGEDDAAFLRTLATVRAAGFSRIHVFPFSARPGTAAAELSGAPRPEAVRERRATLSETASELGAAFRNSLDGATDTVVLEGSVGLSGRYQRVLVPMGEDLFPGDLTAVRLSAESDSEGGVRLHGNPLTPPTSLVRGVEGVHA
jgi:threonylcarbamoyladenosine tRNA methylthiotransferase MtaB